MSEYGRRVEWRFIPDYQLLSRTTKGLPTHQLTPSAFSLLVPVSDHSSSVELVSVLIGCSSCPCLSIYSAELWKGKANASKGRFDSWERSFCTLVRPIESDMLDEDADDAWVVIEKSFVNLE